MASFQSIAQHRVGRTAGEDGLVDAVRHIVRYLPQLCWACTHAPCALCFLERSSFETTQSTIKFPIWIRSYGLPPRQGDTRSVAEMRKLDSYDVVGVRYRFRNSKPEYGRLIMGRLPTKLTAPIGVRSTPAAAQPGENDDRMPVGRGLDSRVGSCPAAATAPVPRLLRFRTVQERTGLSRSTIWRLEQRGAFPRHRRISTNTVAWVEEEITAWIFSKVGKIAV
jgi:prophage regulatory protein